MHFPEVLEREGHGSTHWQNYIIMEICFSSSIVFLQRFCKRYIIGFKISKSKQRCLTRAWEKVLSGFLLRVKTFNILIITTLVKKVSEKIWSHHKLVSNDYIRSRDTVQKK